jgi:hypothetical protein
MVLHLHILYSTSTLALAQSVNQFHYRIYTYTLGEHIGNLMGTHWELERNKGKMKKNSPSHPPPPKKSKHFECMLSLPIGCMKFLFPKLFITIFGLS